METTHLNLRPELKQPLQEMSVRLQKNTDWIINQALESFLMSDALEEERWQETIPALNDIAAGRIVSTDKVDAWLDSWDTDHELPTPRA